MVQEAEEQDRTVLSSRGMVVPPEVTRTIGLLCGNNYYEQEQERGADISSKFEFLSETT